MTRIDNAGKWKPSEAASIIKGPPVTIKLKDQSASEWREALSAVARDAASPWRKLLSSIDGFKDVESGAATQLTGIKVASGGELTISHSGNPESLLENLAHPALARCATDTPSPFRVETYSSVEEAFQALAEGKVDVAESSIDRPPIPEGFRVDHPSGNRATPLTYLAFTPDLAGTPLVKAISLSIDRFVIVDAVFGPHATAVTRWLPGPPLTEGECPRYIRKTTDAEAAKGLGAAVSDISLTFPSTTELRFAAQAISLQTKSALGFEPKLNPIDPAQFNPTDHTKPGALLISAPRSLLAPNSELRDRFTDHAGVPNIESTLCSAAAAIPLWREGGGWVHKLDALEFDYFGLPRW